MHIFVFSFDVLIWQAGEEAATESRLLEWEAN